MEAGDDQAEVKAPGVTANADDGEARWTDGQTGRNSAGGVEGRGGAVKESDVSVVREGSGGLVEWFMVLAGSSSFNSLSLPTASLSWRSLP